MNFTATTARQAAETAYVADDTQSNLEALQAASAAEMDEYLAGFDARHAEDEYTEGAPAVVATPVIETPAEKVSPFAEWFQALIDQDLPTHPAFETQAYAGYVAYGVSMTDGYFIPKDFDAWVIGFREAPATELYYGNDKRHELAPHLNSYAASL